MRHKKGVDYEHPGFVDSSICINTNRIFDG